MDPRLIRYAKRFCFFAA